MKIVTIGLRIEDFYDLLDECDMSDNFERLAERIRDMFQTQFPNVAIEIEWLD